MILQYYIFSIEFLNENNFKLITTAKYVILAVDKFNFMKTKLFFIYYLSDQI